MRKETVKNKVRCESPLRCGNYASHWHKTERKWLCDKCAKIREIELDMFCIAVA